MKTYTRYKRPTAVRRELEFPGKHLHLNHYLALVIVGLLAVIGLLVIRDQLHLGGELLPTLQSAGKGVLIYDRNDQYVCTVHADRDRQIVPLSDISSNMRMAVLAAEDHRFYDHHGVDFIGLARAFNKNQKAGRIVEGGSTITQQLVRGLYLDKNDRSYVRKIKEVILASEAELFCSKAKIIETYLNDVYFGEGVYGVERAANNYFDKHASELSVPESAFLAGLIKSPSVLGVPENRQLAVARQHDVLDKMVEYGYIPKSQLAACKARKLVFQRGENPIKYPYYVAYALQEAHKVLGDDMWSQTVNVYTNLDPAAQAVRCGRTEQGHQVRSQGSQPGGIGHYLCQGWSRARRCRRRR